MPSSDSYPVGICWDKGRGNAVLILIANQALRVIKLESQPEHRGDGRKRDIALVPVQPDADYFFALPGTFADDTTINQRCSV